MNPKAFLSLFDVAEEVVIGFHHGRMGINRIPEIFVFDVIVHGHLEFVDHLVAIHAVKVRA
jgi:hypothetical protein